MLQRTLWVLVLGLGFVLIGAPAQAAPCGHSCEKKSDHALRGSKNARNASSIELKSTARGARFSGVQIPVDGLPRELSALAKKGDFSALRSGHSKRHDSSSLGFSKWDDRVLLPPKHSGPDKVPGDLGQSAIPEPTALLLLSAGLLVAQATLRRRRI